MYVDFTPPCPIPRFFFIFVGPSDCSAFVDTDAAFGSSGSIFKLLPTLSSGAISLNPPYVTDYYVRMTALLQARLAESDKAGLALSFTVVVGANEEVRQQVQMPWPAAATPFWTTFRPLLGPMPTPTRAAWHARSGYCSAPCVLDTDSGVQYPMF